MKNLINKITNKARLVKLYECEECIGIGQVRDSFMHNIDCPKCNGKGYVINLDSQVLDIVEELITARAFILAGSHNMNGISHNLASALIKLIELAYSNESLDIDIDLSDLNSKKESIDRDIGVIISSLLDGDEYISINSLLDFCNHHKIDIWDSVKEILEGEG